MRQGCVELSPVDIALVRQSAMLRTRGSCPEADSAVLSSVPLWMMSIFSTIMGRRAELRSTYAAGGCARHFTVGRNRINSYRFGLQQRQCSLTT